MTRSNQLRLVKTMHLNGRRMFSREINLLSMASVVFSSALVSISLGNALPVLLFSIHMMKMPQKMPKEKTTSLLIGFTVLRLSVHHVVLSLVLESPVRSGFSALNGFNRNRNQLNYFKNG